MKKTTHGIIAIALLSGCTLSAYITVKILQNIKKGDWSALKWYFFHWYRRIREQLHFVNLLVGFLGGVLVYRVGIFLLRRKMMASSGEQNAPYSVGRQYLISQNVHLIRSRQKIQQELDRVLKEKKDLDRQVAMLPHVSNAHKKDQSVQTQNAFRRAYERVWERVKLPGMHSGASEEQQMDGNGNGVVNSPHAAMEQQQQQQHLDASPGSEHAHHHHHREFPLQQQDHRTIENSDAHADSVASHAESSGNSWIHLRTGDSASSLPRNLLNQTTSSVRRYWDSSLGRMGGLFGGAGSNGTAASSGDPTPMSQHRRHNSNRPRVP